MNPYRDPHLDSRPQEDGAAAGSLPRPPPYSPPEPYHNSHNPPLPVIHTGHSSVTYLSHTSPPCPAPSDPVLVRSPDSDRSASPLPGSDLGFSIWSRPQSSLVPPAASATPNPYPASAPATPPSGQVSVIIPYPDLRPSPLQPQCSEDTSPDLECSICFSQFNNVFRCPKMLQCKHTFCLECLARINVKSAQPNAIQCPLCRGLTPLPTLGLPRLATDSDVLSYLPAAMQRVYSVRFLRNKGKLQVKRPSGGRQRWGPRPLTSLRSNRSLDVGLPSPPGRGPGGGGDSGGGEAGGVGGALFRLTGRPACRALLLTLVVMMMVLLTGIIIFLLVFKNDSTNHGALTTRLPARC